MLIATYKTGHRPLKPSTGMTVEDSAPDSAKQEEDICLTRIAELES
jgi:hypothetical protein